MTKLEMEDWTKKPRVKALLKELEQSSGVVTTPCTQVTRMLVGIMMGDTLPERCSRMLTKGKRENPLAIRAARIPHPAPDSAPPSK